MTTASRNRRVQAVKLADALNAIEGVPVLGLCQNVISLLGKRRTYWRTDEGCASGISS